MGCGNGDEAVELQHGLKGSRVVGLDIEAAFSPLARRSTNVIVADAKSIPFGAHAFHFAVAIHSLEHISRPEVAVREVHRVLRPGGWFYVGAPNRLRLVGYLGAHDASMRQKLVWNLFDYMARMRRRFDNRLGAHAGFSEQELLHMLGTYFADRQIVTGQYLRFRYSGRLGRRILDVLVSPTVRKYAAAAHYVLCRKQP